MANRHLFAPAAAALMAVAVAAPAAADGAPGRPFEAARVVDLTHPMYEGMPVWPGGVPFEMTRLVDYDGGYRLHKFAMGENTGTHVDAPAHFIAGARAIDGLTAGELVVAAVVLDVRAAAAADPDFRLGAAELRAWEARHGPIPARALVIVNTGWHRRFADPQSYVNMDAEGVMHFPGLGRDGAALLVARDVAGVGIDTMSLDFGASTDFAAHRVLLGADRYGIENLANLDALPPTGATAVVGGLNVRGGSQAQARILALLPRKASGAEPMGPGR